MNLLELRDAYAAGTITSPMMLDNDYTGVYDNDNEVFTSDPRQLLRDALDLLGIPHESV